MAPSWHVYPETKVEYNLTNTLAYHAGTRIASKKSFIGSIPYRRSVSPSTCRASRGRRRRRWPLARCCSGPSWGSEPRLSAAETKS
jgi:hypothetical protein